MGLHGNSAHFLSTEQLDGTWHKSYLLSSSSDSEWEYAGAIPKLPQKLCSEKDSTSGAGDVKVRGGDVRHTAPKVLQAVDYHPQAAVFAPATTVLVSCTNRLFWQEPQD